MSKLTLDVGELRKRWMEIYLNLMVLRTEHPGRKKLLQDIKVVLAETNEKLMDVLDALEKPMEAEG